MPERYDRATCASELATRSKVLAEFAAGWRPAGEFEIPEYHGIIKKRKKGKESDSAATDTSETSPEEGEVDISKLYE